MTALVATLTQRGQVTVPVEVRRRLGLKPGDKVAFTLDNGVVQLRPATFTLETAFGSVPPATGTDDFKAMSRAAWEEKVRRDYGGSSA